MSNEEKYMLDELLYNDKEEIDEEPTPKNVDEIIQKNIEEINKSNSNDKEIISKYNKENLLSSKDIKSEKTLEEPDLVEQLFENQDISIYDNENKKEKKSTEQKRANKKNPNKKIIKFPENFKNNPTPIDFIDFMERKYNKCLLEDERDKYFYLEKCNKEGKFKEVKCWEFTPKNEIMSHIVTKEKHFYKKKRKREAKITCIVANDDLIYIGDDFGVIKIFSLNKELEIGPLNYKHEDLPNIYNNEYDNENLSITSMDILPNKNLLVCGYYNGLIEVWDLENKKCKKKLLPQVSKHNSQILAVKFLNGNENMIEIISSDGSGLVNITALTKGLLKFFKNVELKAEVNPLLQYSQPIFVVEILKFSEEEKKMPFFKQNIEIAGFACYDYVFIYQINPNLIELFKFCRPTYFSDYYIADISFGEGYLPRTKNIIDINRDQNQKLNEKASEFCIDAKDINRLISVSWDTFINIYAVKYAPDKGVETIAFVGSYVNSCQIKRMLFVENSVLFIYDAKGRFKLLNTGMMSPEEIVMDEKKEIPLYDKEKAERALIQEPKNVVNKVLIQNYIRETTKKTEDINKTKETYYNSIYANNNNIYILGEDELEYGKIYNWEECLNKLKNNSEWIYAFVFGLKLYKGEYISYSGVPIDEKKRKEKIGEKMRQILKEYIIDCFKVDKEQIKEKKYNEMVTLIVYISIELCFEIQSTDFLFKEIAPIFTQKKLEKFFYESLEPYIINGNIGNQIFSEDILKKLINLFAEENQYQKIGQIIKNLYLSVADSEVVGNRTTKYDTIFTGLITYCSGEKNKDFMLPAREIYSYLQSTKAIQIPKELYLKVKEENEKKYFYFDYENVVNNTDIDELILSYQYLGCLLLWYIELCLEGYKFPSNKLIDDKKYESLIQQLFLWLINDEVLQRLIEFDSYTIFFIFKKFFMKKQKILAKIEYSDLFKLIKIGDKELQEAKIQKYIEIIFRKASRIDKGTNSNIYVDDDLYDFICTIATKIQILEECEPQNNYLLHALYHVINYKENQKIEEQMEKEVIQQKGDNYIKNTELKDKYDRFCLHLNRYKGKMFLTNLSYTIMAAIENNIKIFSTDDLKNLMKKAEKTELTRLKIYLAELLEDFTKCLDIYLTEVKGEEQLITLYTYIELKIKELKDDQKKYAKFKNDILSRVTEISSLSIEKVIDLTDNLFEGNHTLVLFKINNKINKLKYLEEILYKYREDEISPTDPIAKEYIEILKLHIDLLCELKYYDKILPNLKKRYFYPVDYCLKKCNELYILDACIYLERKSGNINKAIDLVNLYTKEHFNKFKKFLKDNCDEIIKLEQNENKINVEEEYSFDNDSDNSDNENKNENDDILTLKKKLNIKQNKILKIGIEICESASEILSKEEAIQNWSSILKMHYELIKETNEDKDKKELNSKIGEKLIKDIEDNIDEIIEKMNSHFNLNIVLTLLSNILGKSFGSKEFKSHLEKLVFSGMAFNFILKSAKSILKDDALNLSRIYRNIILKGKQFEFEKCDLCGNIFKENEKKDLVFFNCGHKYHYDCTIFVNDEISCKICKDYEYINEDTTYREGEEIRMNDEEDKKNNKSVNRINYIRKKSSFSSINIKVDREKKKKMKLLNDVNKRYFENTKIFE